MKDKSRSLLLAEQYLGKAVSIITDRPLGSKHPKHSFVYEVTAMFPGQNPLTAKS